MRHPINFTEVTYELHSAFGGMPEFVRVDMIQDGWIFVQPIIDGMPSGPRFWLSPSSVSRLVPVSTEAAMEER